VNRATDPERITDHEFWHMPVVHSEPPSVLPSEPVLRRPSPGRSRAARTLFAVVFASALLLVGYAVWAHYSAVWDFAQALFAD
jgi:hypothetical protein